MADSDDEYERRRRDKFRGERSDYSGGRNDRREDSRRREDWGDGRGREAWTGRERGSRRDYGRDYGRSRERYSPIRHDITPPMKRMRMDWEERRYPYENSYAGYGSYGHDYPPGVAHAGGGGGRLDELGPTQPPMMSFKAFMEQCDDTISEEEALRKYSDYKLEFKRQQLNEFFVNHKEEEWFKAKYHPEECVKRKEDQLANLKRRVKVFQDLNDASRLDHISVDADQSDQLLKLLDSVVIKLEGGSDFDLQILEQPQEEEKTALGSEERKPFILGEESDEEKKNDGSKPPLSEPLMMEMSMEQMELQKKAKEYLQQKDPVTGESRKRKRSGSSSSSSSCSSSCSGESDSEDEPAVPGTEPVSSVGNEEGNKVEVEKEKEEQSDVNSKGGDEVGDKAPIPNGDMEVEKDVSAEKGEDLQEAVKDAVSVDGGKEGTNIEMKEGTEENPIEPPEEEEETKPKPLHKTASIFLRNLAPTITKQEVEAMCRRYQGFLRAAIADPQPERRWFRRGWVTFKREVNIKEICWNLNNIRLRDCELGAIVNRDLSRRIRTVNGITSHRSVVRADIKLSAKIIQNLDSRWCLWQDDGSGIEESLSSLTSSLNPVLRNITDYLIEEASAEEEELLGANNEDSKDDKGGDGESIERDPILIKVLDRLLLYLRIVHSVDYYNHSEYPNEDEMPNRCGIMHARGIPPSSKVTCQEVQDYCRSFENKIGSFLQPLSRLNDDDAKKLGLKEADDEVEKFIHSNCQEVGKEKYQCPLCGKKFKASEFVHKHIQNKHSEKVQEVRKEVEYFNNYLRDPKRPQLPEYPGSKQGGRKEDRVDPYIKAYPMQAPMYGGAYGGGYGNRYPTPGYGNYGSHYPKDFYGREHYPREAMYRPRATYKSRSGDPREIVIYQDLDNLEDVDLF